MTAHTGDRPKVLLMSRPGAEGPWRADFQAALGPEYDLVEWAPSLPFADQVAGAIAVADLGASLTPEMVDDIGAAGVRLWQVLGTGADHLDLMRLREVGVAVANAPGPFSAPALAEHALMLMLYIARDFGQAQVDLGNRRAGRVFAGELHGKTLGLVGLGASAAQLGQVARSLGMHVLAIARNRATQARAVELGIELLGGTEELDTMLARSDFVSIHVPLTAATRGLFDAGRFAAMKRSAVLINVARGAIVDQQALATALRAGTIRAAGVDVFEHEPIDPSDPLLALDNLVATPHVAGATFETSRRRGAIAADNVKRVARGLEPEYTVVPG